MTVTVTTEDRTDLQADLLLVPLTTDPFRSPLDALTATFGDPLARAADDFDGEVGTTRVVYPDADDTQIRRVALVGLGSPDDLDEEALRHGAGGGASVARDLDAASVACLLPETTLSDAAVAQSLVEGLLLGAYRYQDYKTDPTPDALKTLTLHAGDAYDADAVRTGAETGRILAEAACTARDLVNRPPNAKTARDLADAIQTSGAAHGYDVDVWDETRIRDEGMGGLLAVNQGSVEPPTFSVLTWAPDDAVNDAPVVLAGKGVVFDTGGLSLKDTKNSMDLMKSDMAGAAAVIGTFEALADLDVPLHVVGLVPATDNRPGQNAYVPGDVIRMHSGATVEVLNTDAEGRLLLADALSYAQSLAPELVVDAATLTGSSVVALGTHAAAVMTSETDDAAERLYAIQRAGERSGERVHPLPMYDAYKRQLDSDVADLKNVGGRKAGAITAGKFLEHFTDFPWMHLDIAGPAFLQTEKPYRPTGGTGFGVRLLATYLRGYVTARHT
jgi:leucyl aminopeptidase